MKNIIHLIGYLGRGGDSSVVFDVMRHADPNEIHFDFITHDRADMQIVEKLRKEGHRVYVLDGDVRKLGPVKYYNAVKKILESSEIKYDAIHVHTALQSCVTLMAAKRVGIAKRICHAHTSSIQNRAGKLKELLLPPIMRQLCVNNATALVGCSRMAGDFLFGRKTAYNVLYNGIDTKKFIQVTKNEVDRVRKSIGLDDSDIVIGHVAHFGQLKNHAFDMVLMEKLEGYKNIKLVLVGKGTEFEKIKECAKKFDDRVIMLGQRSDIPVLMKGFDCVILPSLPGEGFPVTIMEAQAAGCRCIISEHVTPEVEVGLNLVSILPLSDINGWAEKIKNLTREDDIDARNSKAAELERKGFGKDRFVERWLSLYE